MMGSNQIYAWNAEAPITGCIALFLSVLGLMLDKCSICHGNPGTIQEGEKFRAKSKSRW